MSRDSTIRCSLMTMSRPRTNSRQSRRSIAQEAVHLRRCLRSASGFGCEFAASSPALEAHLAGPRSPLEDPRRGDQSAQPPDRSHRHPRRAGAHRHVWSEFRTRRPVPRHRWRQHRQDPQRSSLRQTLRRVPQTRQQRQDERATPPQPRQRSSREQRALHHHHRAPPPPPTHPRLRRETHRRRTRQTRDQERRR